MPATLSTARRVVVPPLDRVRAPNGSAIRTLGGETMGTTWSTRLVAERALDMCELQRTVEGVLETVVAQMSPWRDDSDISRFNHAERGVEHALPEPFFSVLACAVEVARESRGAYDPTAGPLVDLWGFGPAGPRREAPASHEIEAARRSLGWDRLALDATLKTARQPGGVELDLSAIAKGYAVDALSALLESRGIGSFLVEIGGELRGAGIKPDGQPWWVALERPPSIAAPVETVVALHGLSVATSGDYRRAFEHDGVRYAHTIDPRTGRPVVTDVGSVTVLHCRCMLADALSTALFVLGPEKGFDFAAERGIAALFVRRTPRGVEEVLTPSFLALLD